jgi:ElaB/YqjD/DUF883 family membrane-anchored ribosome-binding protein
MKTNEMMEQATDRAKGTAENITEKAQNFAATAKQKAYEAGTAADFYVREYAWTSMALVAVTAGLVGYALGRRQS